MTPPAIPLPDPLPLAAPPGLFLWLSQLTFLLHTVAMNLLLGGSILALVWRLGRSEADEPQRRSCVAWFAHAAPVLMATTVTLGVAPLLFVQVLYGRVFFVSSILMAWPWLMVVPILIVAYLGLYTLALRREERARGTAMIAVGVTLLLALVALVYTTNLSAMVDPAAFLARYRADPRGLSLRLADPQLIPRYLHTLLSALAVAAIAVALLGRQRARRDPAFGAWAVRRGLVWFGSATAVNCLVGLWYLLAQPRATLRQVVTQDALPAALLALALVLPFVLLVGVPAALGARDPGRGVGHLAGTLGATLVVMVLLRAQVRQITLARAGFALPGWVETQWIPLALFLVLFMAGAAVVAWMIRALARAPG
jgi:hypothetical protein